MEQVVKEVGYCEYAEIKRLDQNSYTWRATSNHLKTEDKKKSKYFFSQIYFSDKWLSALEEIKIVYSRPINCILKKKSLLK